jgi:hypothetical protein
MKLIELFPWSAEARIINYFIDQSIQEDDNTWKTQKQIARGSTVHDRTLLSRVPKLIKMGILQKSYRRDTAHRKQAMYRLASNPIVTTLFRLENNLHD